MKARLPTLENPELRDLPKPNAQANANASRGPSCAIHADMVIIGDERQFNRPHLLSTRADLVVSSMRVAKGLEGRQRWAALLVRGASGGGRLAASGSATLFGRPYRCGSVKRTKLAATAAANPMMGLAIGPLAYEPKTLTR